MSQPPDQQPQWWRPPGAPPQQAPGWQPGQWPQNAQPGAPTGSYTGPPAGQWQQHPPGAPQQQFGGAFQPSAYGGLGVFDTEPARKPKSRKPLLITGVAVLVLAIGGGAAWLLGAFRGDTLDQKSLQDGVVKVLNENYGEPDVKNAECPAHESVRNGTTFDCSVQIGGQAKKVTVRVLNDRPEYEVGAPH